MTPIMTIGWERAENAADLPRDSGHVFPEPILTIAWRPMLSSAVLDWQRDQRSGGLSGSS